VGFKEKETVLIGIDDYMALYSPYISPGIILEIRRDCLDKPLVIEAVSRRVFPAQGYRKGTAHEEVWLIIERRKKDEGEYELRYFFSNMPQDMPALEMVRLFHERFWIEQGYQQLKEELGLDHHEGRSWTGWRRHVLLVMLAFGYLTLQRIQKKNANSRTCGIGEWEG
jgi:hypothetical protein